jgi:site-specific DNA-methyltransferase (adenine-specific)
MIAEVSLPIIKKQRSLLPEQRLVNQVTCGDSAVLLKSVTSDSIDLVITSPPYFQQRNYGSGGIGNEKNPDDYISALLEIFKECVRVLKPTGSIIFNLGDKYEDSSLMLLPYRFAIAATSHTKVSLVNQITWLKTNPTPRQFKRRLVSSTEPFFHFVKSNAYQYFIDDYLAPIEMPKPTNAGENVGQKYFGLIEQSNLTETQKAMARHALSQIIEEVKRGELQGFRMKIRGIHSEPFGGQEGGRKIQLDKHGFTLIRVYGNPLKKDVLISPVESIKNCPHPAIYPVKIIEELIKLLTREGDIVLDPFLGSGSTAVAAVQNNRQYIGFEISQEYCNFAKERLENLSTPKPPVKDQLAFWENHASQAK